MSAEMPLKPFFSNIPKLELHAHINGSVSEHTMGKLLAQKQMTPSSESNFSFTKGQTATLDDCFKKFKLIHQITDNVQAVYMITRDIIQEFAAENVKYIELRSTPREVTQTGMTKDLYIESIMRAIEDSKSEDLDIIVKFILAIDRRNGVEVGKQTLELAEKYRNQSNGTVVGLDLSGDPAVGDARDFIPIFKDAKNRGIKLALHLAEVPAISETLEILKILPDRIGHGTCLQPETGGSQELVDFVYKHQIPLELCLTSNLIGQTVDHLDNHHFKYWYDKGHPCIICTDDKGVFSTSLSEEYAIAKETFDLSQTDVWDLSYNSIDHIFADSNVKQTLKQIWSNEKSKVMSI